MALFTPGGAWGLEMACWRLNTGHLGKCPKAVNIFSALGLKFYVVMIKLKKKGLVRDIASSWRSGGIQKDSYMYIQQEDA